MDVIETRQRPEVSALVVIDRHLVPQATVQRIGVVERHERVPDDRFVRRGETPSGRTHRAE
jgi:hypothetical protein